MRWISAIVLLLGLAGCASMNFEQCISADWYAIGFEDGAEGKTTEQLTSRREACAEHGITPNFASYMNGRVQGLTFYCRPQNGYRLGTEGQRYYGVCPSTSEAVFVAAHSDGYGLYELRTTLKRIENRLRHKEARTDKIDFLLAEKTTLLISPDLGAAARATTAIELKQLAEEKGQVEQAIRQLEGERAAAKHNYETYRTRVSYQYTN